MGKKKPTISIPKYFMSIHLGICHGPVDSLKAIYVNDREAWSGDISSELAIPIDKEELFGGIRKEGGVSGIAYYLPGGPTQTLLQNLAARLGLTQATSPGYRALTSIFFVGDLISSRGFYWSANQPSIKPIAVKVARFPKTLSNNFSNINGNANPAHIIHECLLNKDWGMGASINQIDQTSFAYAAELLFNEGLGLSMMWVSQSSVEDFIKEVLDHIQATFYLDPKTGLFNIKLIRDDYDINNIPVFDETNSFVSSFQRKGWGETINEIVVTWTNPANEKEETVSLQDIANINIQGALISDSRNYYGVRSAETAKMLAARDLRTSSAPLASVEISVNRVAWDLVPGDVFKLTYPEYGIESLIFRITSIDYGKIGEPEIKILAVEDVFSLSFAEYSEPPSSGWVDPSEEPSPMAFSRVMTLPYYFIVNNLAPADVSAITSPEEFVGVLAAQTGQDTFTFELVGTELDPLGNTVETTLGERNCVGRTTLSSALIQEDVSTLTFNNPFNGIVSLAPGGFILLGSGTDSSSELCLVQSVSGNSVTLSRGVLDTTPKNWSIGSSVFIFEKDSNIVDVSETVAGEVLNYKLLSRTSLGLLPLSSAPILSATVPSRLHLPYRPSNCSVNGVKFGVSNIALTDNLALTWANRNRLIEDTVILNWSEASVTPESGQLTRITLLTLTNTIIQTYDVSGSSFSIPNSVFNTYSSFKVRFEAINGTLVSFQNHEIQVNRL